MDPSHFSLPSSPSSVFALLQPPYPSRTIMNGNRSIPAAVPSASASKVSLNFSTSISKPPHHYISTSPGNIPHDSSMLCTPKKSTTRTRGKNGRFESSSDPRNRSCAACGTSETTQWRTGSDGTILCNPCGIRQRKPTTQSATAVKKRIEVQRAVAVVSAAATERKKKAGSSASNRSSIRSEIGPRGRQGGSNLNSEPNASSTALHTSRARSEQSRKKRRDVCSIDNLLNPQ